VCTFCGYDLRQDEIDNPPPALSELAKIPADLFPTKDLMTAAKYFLILALFLGLMIIGILSYGIGERQFFDDEGDRIRYAD